MIEIEDNNENIKYIKLSIFLFCIIKNYLIFIYNIF